MDKSWFDEGKQTYVLDSLADLRGFQDLLKSENFKGKTLKLAADITLNEGNAKDWRKNPPANEWIPLGWTEVGKRSNLQKFAGTFDGQGHTISGVYMNTNANAAGLDGVVCSPLEAGMVKDACGTSFMTVTPGVRFADGEVGDQVRVTTPEKAKEIGSDYIVVGRPITAAEDPVAAYRRCVKEFVD